MLDRRLGRLPIEPARSKLRVGGLALIGLVALVWVIGVLGHSARVDEPTDLDVRIHHRLVDLRGEWPKTTRFMRGVTRLGDPPVAAAATLGVVLTLSMLHRRSIAGIRRREALVWLTVIVGAQSLSHRLKLYFERQRPPVINHLVVESAFSFPSGHSVFASAFYTMLAILLSSLIPPARIWLRRLVVAVCILIALAVGLSRVWLGVHYPTDVLGGFLIGTSIALGGWLIRISWPSSGSKKGEADLAADTST